MYKVIPCSLKRTDDRTLSLCWSARYVTLGALSMLWLSWCSCCFGLSPCGCFRRWRGTLQVLPIPCLSYVDYFLVDWSVASTGGGILTVTMALVDCFATSAGGCLFFWVLFPASEASLCSSLVGLGPWRGSSFVLFRCVSLFCCLFVQLVQRPFAVPVNVHSSA